jgi:hypothetical protein
MWGLEMDETAEIIQFPTRPEFQTWLNSERKAFDLQLAQMRLAEKTGDHQRIGEVLEFMQLLSWRAYCPATRARAEVVCAYAKKPAAKKPRRKAG